MVADPARMALAKKVEVVEDPAITALGSKFRHKVHVMVHLNDGTVLEETVESPRGSEKNFANASDIKAKFMKLAGRVFGPVERDRLMELILSVDALSDVGLLAKALKRR
jgi:2-methylcitrate dehydratase PrpD